jgi:hypothetical protein
MEPVELDKEFALDIIAPGLEGFEPPEGTFDPLGSWELAWRVCTLTANCAQVGSLRLQRTVKSRRGAELWVEYEKTGAGGARQQVKAGLDCATDGLSTPRSWTYAPGMVNADGDPIPLMTLAKSAKRRLRTITFGDGTYTTKLPAPPAYTVNWALFDAVQRLPREPFEPLGFTMFDHFDQPKANQVLSYRKAIDVRLGWQRVKREQHVELPKGRIRKTRWVKEGGRTVRLHAYDHVGEGIVPWVYWVDGQGRLLFVVAGLEAYVLESAKGA